MGRILHTRNGVAYVEWPVVANDKCGVLVLAGASMLERGLPSEVVRVAINGELAEDMDALLVAIREKVVHRSRGHVLSRHNIDSFKGRDRRKKAFGTALKNPKFGIRSRELWEKVMRHPNGWVDGLFLLLGAEELVLDFGIVIQRKDGKLTPYGSPGATKGENHYMSLWDQCGHFSLLVRQVNSVSHRCLAARVGRSKQTNTLGLVGHFVELKIAYMTAVKRFPRQEGSTRATEGVKGMGVGLPTSTLPPLAPGDASSGPFRARY